MAKDLRIEGHHPLYIIRTREGGHMIRQSQGSRTAVLYDLEGLRRALRHMNLNFLEVVEVSLLEKDYTTAQAFVAKNFGGHP